MKKQNKYDLAVIFDCISDGYNTFFLIPKMVIEGNLNDDVFVTKDGTGYPCAIDAALEDYEQCFGFPITSDTILEGNKKLSDYNYKDLEKLMSDYMEDISRYNYYQWIDDDFIEITTYKIDNKTLEIASVDINSNLYSSIERQKLVAKSIQVIDTNLYNNDQDINSVNVKAKPQEDIETKSSTKKEDIKQINIEKAYKRITKNVLFQDEQVRKILTAIAKNQLVKNPKLRTNILIVGPTGVGKTEIIRSLSKELNLSIGIEDATQYTIAGYVGKSVDEMLENLYEQAGGNLELAERGILFIDEIDKKANNDNKSDSVAGKGVLNSLLKIMEDGQYTINIKNGKVNFDTSKLTIIVAGAFSDINEMKDKKLGFDRDLRNNNKETIISNEALVKYGMPPEFLGRCQLKVFLNKLGIEELKVILKKSSSSHLVLNRSFFSSYGIKLSYDKAIDEIAKEAYKLGTGARSLNSIVEEALSEATFKILANPNQYSELVITSETISDNKKYLLKTKKN